MNSSRIRSNDKGLFVEYEVKSGKEKGRILKHYGSIKKCVEYGNSD